MGEVEGAITRYIHIKEQLHKHNFTVNEYKLINYGLQFKVSLHDWTGIMRIYQNKKGIVKVDLSQLSDDTKGKWIKNIIEGKNGVSIEDYSDNTKIDVGLPVIGTDESGKGDYFGPLVTAGVYIDKYLEKELERIGIRDSKKLSDKRNLELAKEIKRICYSKYAIIEVSPDKYNDLYEQFQREKKNLNTLLAWSHAKAIEEILTKNECNKAIADQFADEKFILGKLQEKGKEINLIQMHKAERNVAVAAASILARARFLEKLASLSSQYNINFPKGGSGKVVNIGKDFIMKHGNQELRKVAKLHFKTTSKIIDE